MAVDKLRTSGFPLARQVRERFVGQACEAIKEIAPPVQARLMTLVDSSGNAREMQDRRDAWLAFQKLSPEWLQGTIDAWRKAPSAASAPPPRKPKKESLDFELIGHEVVENKILASRLALSLLDKVTWELNDLRLRIQHLEGSAELASTDILRPEVLMQIMMDQWAQVGLSREAWGMAQEVVQQHLVDRMVDAYHQCNEFLIERGVMPEIDLRPAVQGAGTIRRTPESPAQAAQDVNGDDGGGRAAGPGGHPSGGGQSPGRMAGGTGGYGGGGGGGGGGGYAGAASAGRGGQAAGPGGAAQGRAGRGGGGGGDYYGAGPLPEESRMMTAATPLARVRMRAQGVMGQLKRMLGDQVPEFEMTRPTRPSPALAQALEKEQAPEVADYELPNAGGGGGGMLSVEQATVALRERTTSLKKKAATQTEKATIEIVALMFQSILAEDRIPPNVRVWFARLQMPVLRVALGEPEFFDSLEHPARKLIDRMGSCVLGFDAAAITGGALEGEIRRIVQVIEQYPETGRRVFQLVFDEFQKFLSKFLTEKGGTQRLVSVAQQIEQKETMVIQFTIEMRNMLNDMPVRDEIRAFLFRVWAEVLAIAAMKNGPQHAETIALKKSAADLVWAASAKPNRNDRARVIQDLPHLLQRIRLGMTLVGIEPTVQEQHIKTISDTLADAFMSKTDAIPHERIEEMAKRLSNLEDYITDDEIGELPLDADSIELMLGIDTSDIEIVADGGSTPTDAMIAWAQELQPGTWYTLDHNGKMSQVQLAWRSDRKQLNLFASTDGRSYLVQAQRLASYLQAGLLIPAEEEALTVRATRDAMTKLNANPERLLQ
jgi:hypothetical protein